MKVIAGQGRSGVEARIEVTIPILLPGQRGRVMVTLPREMTAEEWAYFHLVLDAMKPGIAAPDDSGVTCIV